MTLTFSNNQPSNKPATNDTDIIDIGALFSTLWRGKWWISIITALAILLGGYYVFFIATPLYRSTAVVILETRETSIVDLDSVLGGMTGDSSEVNSEVEVLRARKLMANVVTRLNLTADPEFNTDLKPEGVRSKIKRSLGLLDTVPTLPESASIQRTLDLTINQLLERVSIRNIPLSLVFQITVETENPQKSTLIADTIVELYILNQLEVKFEATEQATSWLTNRVTELQVTLETAEAKVKNFNTSIDLIGIETFQALERQLKDLRDRILTLSKKNTSAVNRLKELKAAETLSEKSTATGDSQLQNLMQQSSLEDGSVGRQRFNARFAQIVLRAELVVARLDAQTVTLKASLPELEDRIAVQSEDLIALQQLTREAEASRLLYEYFLARLKETSAQEGIQQADSRILSDAVVPIHPSAPRKSRALAMSGILGLMFGVTLVLLREARNNTYRSARDLKAVTGYTVLGQIPMIPAGNRKNTLHYLADNPLSAAAEAIRNLRTSVLLSNVDSPPQVILMTSALSGEGKTTNALALAQNMIGMGKNVLLIEGDIRRRVFSQYFDIPNKLGLVSVLSGEEKIDNVLVHDDKLGADLLIGEKTDTNAADLFASDKFSAFIENMRSRYDTIIIDSPPVLIVPDARVIAQSVDAILFTVKWDSTTKEQVEEGLQLFESVNQRVTGLVLSQISPKMMKKYGYGYGYGGKYGSKSRYYTN